MRARLIKKICKRWYRYDRETYIRASKQILNRTKAKPSCRHYYRVAEYELHIYRRAEMAQCFINRFYF